MKDLNPLRYERLNTLLQRALVPSQSLSGVLAEIGLSPSQIQLLFDNHLSALTETAIDYIVQEVDGSNQEPRRHRMLLRHYGLVGESKETLKQIGLDHDLSAERVRQLILLRLNTMKQPRYQKMFLEYLRQTALELLGETDAPDEH